MTSFNDLCGYPAIPINNIPENMTCYEYFELNENQSRMPDETLIIRINVPVYIVGYNYPFKNIASNISALDGINACYSDHDTLDTIMKRIVPKLLPSFKNKKCWEKVEGWYNYIKVEFLKNSNNIYNIRVVQSPTRIMNRNFPEIVFNQFSITTQNIVPVNASDLHLQKNPLTTFVNDVSSQLHGFGQFGSRIAMPMYYSRFSDVIILEKWFYRFTIKDKMKLILLGRHKRVGSNSIVKSIPPEILHMMFFKILNSQIVTTILRDIFGIDVDEKSSEYYNSEHVVKKIHKMYYYIDDLCQKLGYE
jgi:hypothetical protein